jgi:circadian clock protein KaiB
MAPRKTYILKLYVAGNTANSMRALKTLRNILDTEFQGVYALKVIDVLQNPQLAEEDKILATPTLAKILPPPVRRIIGDLSDREKVLIGLDLLYDELSEEDFGRDDGLDSAALNDAEFAADRAFPYDRHAHSASPSGASPRGGSPSSADQTLASAGQPGSPERTPTGIAAMGPGPGGGDLESPVALPPLESP